MTINGATVTESDGRQRNIDPTTNVTLDGSAILNMLGNNTLNNVVFKNDGGSHDRCTVLVQTWASSGYMIGSVINSGSIPAHGIERHRHWAPRSRCRWAS